MLHCNIFLLFYLLPVYIGPVYRTGGLAGFTVDRSNDKLGDRPIDMSYSLSQTPTRSPVPKLANHKIMQTYFNVYVTLIPKIKILIGRNHMLLMTCCAV